MPKKEDKKNQTKSQKKTQVKQTSVVQQPSKGAGYISPTRQATKQRGQDQMEQQIIDTVGDNYEAQ